MASGGALEQEARDDTGGGRFLEGGEICAPCLPQGGFVRHCAEDHITNPLRIANRQSANAGLLDEGDVSFLLARNNVTYEERNLRGDCLLHGRATGLSDENVMRGHQDGHVICPAKERTMLWQACIMELLQNVLPSAGDDRHLQLGNFGEMGKHFGSECGYPAREKDRLPPIL